MVAIIIFLSAQARKEDHQYHLNESFCSLFMARLLLLLPVSSDIVAAAAAAARHKQMHAKGHHFGCVTIVFALDFGSILQPANGVYLLYANNLPLSRQQLAAFVCCKSVHTFEGRNITRPNARLSVAVCLR